MPVPKKPSETAEIYGLLDPRDGKLRYIGKAVCARKRLKSHLRDARRRDTPLYRWVKELTGLGIVPGLKILEVCPIELWEVREMAWIRTAREMGGFLLNQAKGGNEPHCSYEVRAANARKAVASRTDTPEKAEAYQIKKFLGQSLAAGVVTEETRVLMRRAARDAPHLFGCWATL
jgi:hypothetical protein